MPVTSVTTDPEALTLTVVADFAAPVERLWEAFADPRRLERFWGPPGYPATFLRHELRPGGGANYHMTGPDGERFYGSWEFTAVDAPRSFAVIDRFTDEDGAAADGMPETTFECVFESTEDGSRFTSVSRFASLADLEKLTAMGMVEGITMAIGQLDAVLADLREYALGKGTVVEVLDDTHVRITRGFEAPRSVVWRAHTEPDLIRRWLLGPDGWTMTVCEVDPTPHGAYRYAWAPGEGTDGDPFGFEGETVVFEPERRWVTTERMTGTDFPGTVNDLSLAEEDGMTLLTLLVTYTDAAQRDAILATGMTEGMEASYQRLERDLLATV